MLSLVFKLTIQKPGMETIMHKHLVNQVILARADNSLLRRWYCALGRWSETRKLRDAVRNHADLVSRLDPHVLCDIGASDFRRSHRRSAVWDQNRYKLLIDTIVNLRG
jgi:hypothetical protein